MSDSGANQYSRFNPLFYKNNEDDTYKNLSPSDRRDVDFQHYFDTSKAGDTQDWAGGTLTRGGSKAYYTSPSGETISFNAGANLEELGTANKDIGDLWKSTYGLSSNYTGGSSKYPNEPIVDMSTPTSGQGLLPAVPPTGGDSQGYVAPSGASVSQGLLALLDDDNPYIVRARTQAAQRAAAQGLQNTTMAQTGGEAAAIDAAYGIAGKDAELFTQLYGQERQGEIDENLSVLQTQQQGWLYRVQGSINAELSKLDAGQQLHLQTTLANLTNDQQTRMAGLEADAKSRLSAQEYNQAMTRELATIAAENAWEQGFLLAKIELEDRQLDATAKSDLTSALTTIENDYANKRMEYLLNPNFETPEDRNFALETLNLETTQRFYNLAARYDIRLTWRPGDVPTLDEDDEIVPIWEQGDDEDHGHGP